MEIKARPFKPEMFDKWEREARETQVREREGNRKQTDDQRERQLWADEREPKAPQRTIGMEVEVYMQPTYNQQHPQKPEANPL